MKRWYLFFSALMIMISCSTRQPAPSDSLSEGEPDTITVFPSDTIGILMGDSNYVFGTISDAVSLDNGNIAVLDEAGCCCRLYGSDGGFITQISRRGSGPGEILLPGGLVRLSDGTLLILDHASGTQRFQQSGEFIELRTDFQGQNVPQWAWGVNDLGYVGAVTEMEMIDDVLTVNFIIGRWDDDPQCSVEYFRNSFPFNPERMDEFLSNSFFSATFAAAEDGTAFVAPISSDRYIVNVYNQDGSLYSTIEREMPRIEKNEEEILEETAMITAILKERGIPEDQIRYTPDPFRWMIPPQGLGADGEGRVWVANGASDEVIMDVYSREGDHLAVVRFQGVKNPDIMDYLNIKVQPERILIYSLQDPDYPRLYVVDMPEID